MKKRPFDVGDLVVSKINGVGYVEAFVSNRTLLSVQFDYGDIWVYDWQGRDEPENEPDIKTIRTPRKGSKEARDIVAMLARYYRENVIKDWKKAKQKKDMSLKSAYKSWTCSGQKSYRKAKEMLK